jgi:hypothetical protein
VRKGRDVKATNKGILARLSGKGRKARPVDTAPVIVGEVPVADLEVHERDDYTLLRASIDRADDIEVRASTRSAALVGMDVLVQVDAERMLALVKRAGSMGESTLKPVIMELAGIGRAHMANEAAGV